MISFLPNSSVLLAFFRALIHHAEKRRRVVCVFVCVLRRVGGCGGECYSVSNQDERSHSSEPRSQLTFVFRPLEAVKYNLVIPRFFHMRSPTWRANSDLLVIECDFLRAEEAVWQSRTPGPVSSAVLNKPRRSIGKLAPCVKNKKGKRKVADSSETPLTWVVNSTPVPASLIVAVLPPVAPVGGDERLRTGSPAAQ